MMLSLVDLCLPALPEVHSFPLCHLESACHNEKMILCFVEKRDLGSQQILCQATGVSATFTSRTTIYHIQEPSPHHDPISFEPDR